MEPENVLRRAVGRVTRRRLIGTVATASALATVGITPARTAFAAQDDEQIAPTEALGIQSTTRASDLTDTSSSHRPGFFDDLGQAGSARPAVGTPRPDGQQDHQAPRGITPSICKGGTDA